MATMAGNKTSDNHRDENKMKPSQIWIEQCEAAKGIESEFGTQKALSYLIGEKFINFLEAAEGDADFRAFNLGLRCRDQNDLRAMATGRVFRDSSADRSIRSR